ncbi:unnamed protein product [Tilletia laevis]|uniref:Uncharacterized protein n=2 Tax=Tilletia TaxID=13289 RepID=A0A9N8LG78_9BASI|nr:hypothetical protein CF336_g5457 [Tilletia laevis]CAD6889263.1 unnamed protein product [Tilletia caries]CAD6914081.1 unnamed protein product [Tilletia laevis]CAD6922517.1 unnamed protein product [Tilletia caries]CAD6942914.1 unnamed protein product [Tilletia laevis]
MATNSSSDRRSKRGENSCSHLPSEYQSTTLEWPLLGLKQLFDSSKGDHKSKVVKSPVFGGGRWTVLFYAQSGSDQYCSLYLNAEPLEHERLNPLLHVAAGAGSAASAGAGAGTGAGASGSGRYHGSGRKTEGGAEEHLWVREGLFRFTFTISVLGNKDGEPLGRKEANDHVFSHKTSNWGWASFARRSDVYYNQGAVKAADTFLITVTISTVYEKPRMYKPVGQQVPTSLISAWGSLLDDPEHSDVVFLFPPKRAANGRKTGPTRKLYAIKKILAARSTYFRDMFEGNFLESEQAEVMSDVGSVGGHEEALLSGRNRIKASSAFSLMDEDDYRVFDMLMDNSDEELDDIFETSSMMSPSTPPLTAVGNFTRSLSGGIGADTSTGGHLLQSEGAGDLDAHDEGEDDMFHDEDEEEDETGQSVDAGQNSSSLGHGSIATQRIAAQDQSVSSGTAVFSTSNNSLYSKAAPNSEFAEGIAAAEGETSTSAVGTGYELEGLDPIDMMGALGSIPESALSAANRSPAPASRSHSGALNSPVKQSSAGLLGVQTKADTPVAKARSRRQMNARSPGGVAGAAAHSSSSTRKRRQVVIQDSAYPTFRALLHFLYTDTVSFAPLTSTFLSSDMSIDELGGFPSTDRDSTNADKFAVEMHKAHKKRKELIESYCSQNADKPQPCSAKAMYKLADKLHIEDLRMRAQDHIASSLTVQCIVYEVFGNFTMRFPEIRKMETEFLLKHWAQVKKSIAMKTIFSRSAAHPGLAEVWPYLLSQLEYKREEASSSDEETE